MKDLSIKAFYRSYLTALEERNAALFIGAGISKPAGLSDWRYLLRHIADDLGLDLKKQTDLVELAQFHVNDRLADRSHLNQLLIDEFTKDVKLTENHRLIVNLPVESVWTTNYDTLLEEAYREAHKRPDVKFTQVQLATSKPRRDVVIYKMHGDISEPNEAVLIKDDYESYGLKRQLFSLALQGDLVSKTFLFLGFSFTDPNVDYILSRIRVMLGQNKREHYYVTKRPDPPRARAKAEEKAQYRFDLKKLELRIDDLKRFSIQTILIDEYSELTDILRELNKGSHLKDVFVSGSAHEFTVFPQKRMEALAGLIGQEIIKRGYNLISGFGLGIGSPTILGAIEAAYSDDSIHLDERLLLRPFPQVTPSGMTREEFHTKYREDIVGKAGYAIFISGNKEDTTAKKTVIAKGMLKEFEIIKKQGKYPIPVGATGDAAKKIWDQVTKDPEKFFPGHNVKKQLKILGNASKSNKEIVEAIFAIIKQISDK